MKRSLISLALLFSLLSVISAEELVLSGTMVSSTRKVAIVNGEVYKVNDRVAGGEIIAIDARGMTFVRGGVTNIYLLKNAGQDASASAEAGTSKESPFKSFSAKIKAAFNKKKSEKPADKPKKEDKQVSQGKPKSSVGWWARTKTKLDTMFKKKEKAEIENHAAQSSSEVGGVTTTK